MNPSDAVRVLLVDDIADLRRVVRGVLEQHGGFVVAGEAGDGRRAVELAADTQPDLVLLDLDMPGMSGLDALPVLRTVAPATKIVVLSGLPADSMAAPSLAAGAVGFLAKGVSARQLIAELVEMTGLLEAVERAVAERHVVVDRNPMSPGAARRFVAQALAELESDNGSDVVQLLVSELVTNAVMHAGSEADVAVILRRDVVRVEVGDRSTDIPTPRRVSPDARSGRGLWLVDQMASAWGVQERPGGKVVWFEVPRRAVASEIIIE
jgi:DNA-binding NarL/FixJ family response regulator